MSDRTEDATPRSQIGSSWIPTTPAKPNLSKWQTNSTENTPVRADWSRTERLTSDNVVTGANLSEVVCQTSDPCPASSENFRELGKGLSNSLEMDEVTKSRYRGENVPKGESSTCKKLSFEDADKLKNVSFVELLDRAQAGYALPRNDYEAASAFAPSQMQGGSSSCSRPLFDLNTVPKSNDDASSSKIAPVTPVKSVIAMYRSDSAVQHMIIDEENSAKQAQETIITLDNAEGIQREKEPSQLSIDHQLHASVSTRLQENHNPDKCSTEEADLSKTLQRKPRRRKHRPKVIREGKPRISRKRNVEVSGTTQDATPAKRRPGRPKANKPDDSIDKGSNEPADASTHRQTRSSCRRSLNFNSEGLVNDDSPLNSPALEKSVTGSLFQSRTGDNGSGTGKVKSDAAIATCGGTCFTLERQVQGHHMDTPVAEFCNMNATGILYNSMQASTATFNHDADDNDSAPALHFPAIYKKKRTEKRHNVVAFSSTSSYNYETATKPSASSTNQGPGPINLLTDCVSSAARDGKTFRSDLLFAIETVKRKRSKVPTRVRDFTSQPEIEQMPTYQGVPLPALTPSVEHKTVILHEPQTCMEALVAYNSSTNLIPKTKKRSKRSVISSGFVQNFDFATQSMGLPLAITWKSQVSIDSITEQLSELDLNAEISEESARNLSMAYHMHYQERRALVPYQSHGSIVPFDSSFNRVRRRRPRAKVDLDDETTRVWELLLENINSEGVDGTNEEKAKWWEEERRVFKGRADSFIARMHLVQGDRRFSPWKGSVVDSVVGVFLTQNVSDHLSSSAFMSLVAKYPAKTEIHLAGKVQEPDWCMVGPDATLRSNRQDNSFCSVESTVLDEFGNDDVREVNSNKTHGNNSDGSIHNLESQSSAASKHVPVVSHESCTNKSMSPIRDGRDKEDVISSQKVEISSQSSADSPTAHTTEISESCLRSTSEELTTGTRSNEFPTYSVSQVAGTVRHVCDEETEGQKSGLVQCANLDLNLQNENNLDNTLISANYQPLGRESILCHSSDSETLATADLSQESDKVLYSTIENETCIAATCGLLSESASQMAAATNEDEPQFSSPNFRTHTKVQVEMEKTVGIIAGHAPIERFLVDNHSEIQEISDIPSQNSKDRRESGTKADSIKMSECKEVNSIKKDADYEPRGKTNRGKVKGEKTGKGKKKVDWDCLREQAKKDGKQRGKTSNTMDSVDWDAVRCADVHEIAKTIKERGMNNVLAGRIKDFLNRLVTEHGSIDLEWLRDVPPDNAKEYLLSIRGLGLKSVECVRLLTLHHLAFPVDTNVGRIAVRLGWVPLQPLPESLQLHLLELYPVLESIQKYLWPRLCKLDQKTLYELHYQMITFGKVFCTKSKPNCNACPMRGECRHFASAFASARLSLPAPEQKSLVTTTEDRTAGPNVPTFTNPLQLPSNNTDAESVVSNSQPIIEVPPSPEPTIEVPATPGQRNIVEHDIEDAFIEDPDEIPTIHLNMEELTNNLQNFMQQTTEFQDGDMTNALVALTAEAASIPVPKLKNVSRLRTEHQVYELPDSHPLLEGLDKREPDDPCPYMLAIWTPGETVNSITPPKRQCNSQESEKLCNDETCLSCNSIREAALHTVRGTLLIPCRTAMRGSFPLNGTYFQVNEVFADHESSSSPMNVPRQWLWNLPRRTVYFGTSIPTIFKGLSTEGIQYCFWRGFVCVRGFERKTRAPRPLIARLHFPASRLNKGKEKMDENQS